MIKREHYLKKIRGFYDSDLIKVIHGIRRSGKSVILDQIRSEISQKTDNIIYLNFEDFTDLEKAGSVKSLLDYVERTKKGSSKCYIFLDEIQNIPNWQVAVRTLRLHNNSIFISGSNSKLLSREFLNELSGRFVQFRIRPFVYKELLEYSKLLGKEFSIENYLAWGGFPKRLEYDSLDDQIRYLKDIDNTIITHDIISRFNIKNEVLFRKVANFTLKK